MGPWDHEHVSIHISGADGMSRIGRREIGDSSVSTYEELLVEFFDHTLRGLDNGFAARPRVQYFTIGDNAWRSTRQWPPEGVQATPMYFHSHGGSGTDSSDGRLDLVRPGDEPVEVYRFAIDLWATSYVVPPGHRLRVEISSSNFPRFTRNLNTGNEFGMSDEIAVADQTIYHSEEYPSHVLLPVMPR
jgi:predicted acyl esterase